MYEKFDREISLSQGNHVIYDPDSKSLNPIEIGYLLHIPIRSKHQLISKVLRSSLSDFSRTTKKPGESFQYKEMLKLIRNSELCEDEIRGCVNLYQKEAKILPITKKDLKSEKWVKSSLSKLKVAHSRCFTFFPQHSNNARFNERIIADHILSLDKIDPKEIIFLDSDSIVTIRK